MGSAEADLIQRLKSEDKLKYFPQLADSTFEKTSDYDEDYNCFAWAMGWTHCRIDPGEPCVVGDFWPMGVTRGRTVRAFVEVFDAQGFSVCDSGEHELGFMKIALYAKGGSATHAARLLEDGRWTSKLGDWDDIAHPDLATVGGANYGSVVRFLKKAIPSPEPSADSPPSEQTPTEPQGSGSTLAPLPPSFRPSDPA